MKRTLGVLGVLICLAIIVSCSKKHAVSTAPKSGSASVQVPGTRVSQNVRHFGPPPAATVKRLPLPTSKATRVSPEAAATMAPTTIQATLAPGQCVSAHDVVHLPADASPAKLDVVFCLDLTASMFDEINNVKANSSNIMTQLRGLVPDSDFGVMSHMDYDGAHSGCNYADVYGSASLGDYPYHLDSGVTDNATTVANAIDGLPLGFGGDEWEDFTRPFYETYSDPNVAWRTGARRVLVQWGDSDPHDCDVSAIIGFNNISFGPDPGRNAIDNDGDDLRILPVLDAMASNKITMVSIHSGFDLTLWRAYAQRTGGDAFAANPDGTLPGDVNIADYVASLVRQETRHVNTFKLATCDPTFSGWLQTVSPASYSNITFDHDQDLAFDIQICVPSGTAPGSYCFDVCALGDGGEFARQQVCITVSSSPPTPIAVPVDFKPNFCPSTFSLSSWSDKTVPVAIAGTLDLSAFRLDPATIRLEGVAPSKTWIQDVARPYSPYTGKSDCASCTTRGRDGVYDLVMNFSGSQLKAALGSVTAGSCKVVHLTGKLKDGTPIFGEDVVTIKQ